MRISDWSSDVCSSDLDDLTTALEGRTVLVDAAEPRQAQKVLVDVPGVLSVAQIGTSLRVLTDRNGDAAARIRGVLEEAGLHAGLDPSQPHMEDVFVPAPGGKSDDDNEIHAPRAAHSGPYPVTPFSSCTHSHHS